MAIEVSGRIGRAQFLRFGYFVPAVTATPTPQPTVAHGRSAVFKLSINGAMTNVSTYLKAAALHREAAPIKTTGISSPAETYIAGPISTTIPFNGFFDPTIAQGLDAITKYQPTAFEYYPAGTATGNHCFSGTASLNKNTTDSPSTEANQISGELTMSGSPRLTTI